jgi:AraC-like DNA-binding protein
MSVTALLVRTVVEALERAGASREDLLAQATIEPERLDRVDERFEMAEFAVLQERAIALTSDPALGLHMGEQTSESALDSIAYLVGHAPTLRDAVSIGAQFGTLALDGSLLMMRESADVVTIHYSFPRTTPVSDRMHAEFVMTGLLRLGRQLAGPRVVPRTVSFEHDRPAYHKEYTRLFGGSERFGQPSTFIGFDRAIADRSQLHKSPELYSVVRAEAERSLERIARGVGPAERLHQYLLARPASRIPDIVTAARDLGISERSLRRQLASENTSYREIVRAVLETSARRMLREPARSIKETAVALGFVDARSFHRAFKAWTGMTPKQYREARGR